MLNLSANELKSRLSDPISSAGCPVKGRHSGPMFTVLDSRARGWAQALARGIMLCSWERHFTLTVPLFTKMYEGVLVNFMLGGNPAMD